MRLPSALLLAALLAPCAASAAGAAGDTFALRCEREMQPVLEVTTHEALFAVDNTVSSRVLNTRGTYASVSQLSLGLTSGTIRTEVTFDAPALVDHGARRECVAPRIWVDLRYDPLRIYVAREFNAHSCSYRTIYAHEMQHIAVYRSNMPLVEQRLRAQLYQRYGKRPLYAAAGRGLDQVEADVDTWLRPLIKAELAKVEALQVALDSPEESFRLSNACGGEVASLVGQGGY